MATEILIKHKGSDMTKKGFYGLSGWELAGSTDENNLAKETILIETLDQYFPSNDNFYSVGVGFILTEDQYNFINN